MKTKNRKTAFSLVELVIVVIIIGVIAAIAVPRISRGAKGADVSAAKGSLAALRSAIDLYAAEHGGTYPGERKNDGTATGGTLTDMVDQLTKFSDRNGKCAAAMDAATGIIFGPYLRKGIPPCPVGANKGSTAVAVGNTGPAVAGAQGWAYNYMTGEIIINDGSTDENSVAYSAY